MGLIKVLAHICVCGHRCFAPREKPGNQTDADDCMAYNGAFAAIDLLKSAESRASSAHFVSLGNFAPR
jgi:hypothetical protein